MEARDALGRVSANWKRRRNADLSIGSAAIQVTDAVDRLDSCALVSNQAHLITKTGNNWT